MKTKIKQIFLFILFLSFLSCIGGGNDTESNNKDINIEILKGEKLDYYLPDKNIVVKNAPKGLSIFPNGELTWTPTNEQEGSHTIYLYKDNKLIQRLEINVVGDDIKYNGYFVDFLSETNGDGTPEKPFNKIFYACEKIKNNNYQKIFVYIRGGIYKTKNYGKSLDNKRIDLIKCYGEENKPIIFRPWGNERVKIVSDGLAAFAVRKGSKYFIIEGLELEGVAQKIKFEEVLNYWWNSKNYYKGSGISINGECHDITIRNNIIHDFPGACISSHNNDGIIYEHNIIYNCAWWSIAGTGGATIVDSKDTLTSTENKIVGNLFFDIESRIFSRVFQKGFSHLVIDEGKATLFQQNLNISSLKFYHLENNFFAYNGKGPTANKVSNVYMRNNSLYHSKALRVGSDSSNIFIEKNATSPKENEAWVSISKSIKKEIIVRKNFYKEGSSIKYKPNPYIIIKNNTSVKNVFENPKSFKLIPEIKNAGAGAASDNWEILKNLINKYIIDIKPTNWDYSEEKMIYMTKKIIESAKNLGDNVIIDCSLLDSDNKVIIRNLPEEFVENNNLPSSDFELILKYPYDGSMCDNW